MNLVIREEDGWVEISEIVSQIPLPAQREIWQLVGKGDMERAAEVLDMEAGAPVEDLFGMKPIEAIQALTVPDDILGERLRVWVRAGKL